jgi:LEA14-like dessication related protein
MTGAGRPRIAIRDVPVERATLSGINLRVTVEIENGNPVAIPIEQIDFDVIAVTGAGERTFAHGRHGRHRIPPGQSTLGIPVAVRNRELIGALSGLTLERSADVRIAGSVRVGLGVLSYTLPISEEKRISS